jgi:adenosylcobinamide-phosphate synthase
MGVKPMLAPALVVLLAAAMDVALGEPPARLHPVVWIGSLVERLRRTAPGHGPRTQLAWGAAVALIVPALCATGALALLGVLAPSPFATCVAGALVLKPCFAIRALGEAGRTVGRALAAGELDAARFHLRSLCSRDPSALSAGEIAAGAVESLAENTSDSVVAPLFYYALFGVPGAIAYRAINTLDAMLGYRGELEYLGKAAARLDDVANWVPARLTAGLLLVAGAPAGGDLRRGLRILRRDGGRTASPNAGRPMAAMAGLLGVALTKPGHYRLGDAEAPLDARTIARAWRICAGAAALAVAGAAAVAAIGSGGALAGILGGALR